MREDNLLQRARLERGLHLRDIARRTCLSPGIVERIDEGRFDELPAGIYARSYVRSFATAVGVDPDAAVRALEARLPRVENPIPAPAESATVPTPAWLVLLTAWSGSTSAWIKTVRRDSPRRPLAARACDAVLLLLTHAVIVQLTALVCGAPPGVVVKHPGVSAVWLILVCLYFLLLGGIGGRTLGEWAVGRRLGRGACPLHLRAILQRAFMF